MRTIREYQARKFPAWIRAALNIAETTVPASLLTQRDANGTFAPITTTIDAFQGGVGIADLITFNAQLVVGSTGVNEIVPSKVPEFCYLVLQVSFSAAALAATRSPRLTMTPPDTGFTLDVARTSLPTNGFVAWKDIAGTVDARWFVPAGLRPIIMTNDIDAAETVTATATILRMPAGFKPF